MGTDKIRPRPEDTPAPEGSGGATSPQTQAARRIHSAAPPEDAPAWAMIPAGRYMPRRIRGSFRGRELG
jgi:hypothetical protein